MYVNEFVANRESLVNCTLPFPVKADMDKVKDRTG